MSQNTITYVATTEYDGGAERHIARLASVVEPSWAVSLLGRLVTPAFTSRNLGAYARGGKWVTRNLPLAFIRLPFERRRAYKIARQTPSSVYHMHFKREQIGFSRAFSRLGAVVWTEHGVFPGRLFGIILRPLYRRAARHVHTIICVSDRVRDSLEVILGSDERLVVIPNAIDVRSFRESRAAARNSSRRKLGIMVERRVALVIGRVASSKRPMLAVEAALAAGCYVIVAGSGPEEVSLVAAFGSSPNVVVLGDVPDPRTLWAAADVHLFLSNGEGEGLPTVLLEAAASSVPSVAAADCGFDDLAVSLGGVASEPTVEAVAAAIREALSLRVDEEVLRGFDLAAWRDGHLRTYEKARNGVQNR